MHYWHILNGIGILMGVVTAETLQTYFIKNVLLNKFLLYYIFLLYILTILYYTILLLYVIRTIYVISSDWAEIFFRAFQTTLTTKWPITFVSAILSFCDSVIDSVMSSFLYLNMFQSAPNLVHIFLNAIPRDGFCFFRILLWRSNSLVEPPKCHTCHHLVLLHSSLKNCIIHFLKRNIIVSALMNLWTQLQKTNN